MDIKQEFEAFKEKYGHYPTSGHEMDKSGLFSLSSRQLTRNYGGLKKLRQSLNLDVTDYTVGKARAKKARSATRKADKDQAEIYKLLLPHFGKYYIHRESPYSDIPSNRSDFVLYHSKGHLYVDVLYPATYQNMTGCLNAKIKKYSSSFLNGEVLLVNLNDSLDGSIPKIIENKKNPIPQHIKLISKKDFLTHCYSLIPIVK